MKALASIIRAAERFSAWVRRGYPGQAPGPHVALVALCGKEAPPDPAQG
ncbi:MAG: hypothetical protein JO280_05970 [Mycobacteriaceae bacterium]|nr:hypothetical protein [Mycobacteriaceae bacterium]